MSTTPNAPTATILKYAPLVALDLSNNAINFADSLSDGHRVLVTLSKDVLNSALAWSRAPGLDRPVGSFLSTYQTTFLSELATALTEFIDLDGVTTGLDFTAGILTPQANQTNTVNDLILQYVLFKVYGLSAYDVANKVFNVSDAANMVDNTQVAQAICNSFTNNNERGQAVDQMFRDLLASDPVRYFDSEGKQITGLFETNSDFIGTGTWLITEGDIIEIKMEFEFLKQVSKRSVRSQQQPLADLNGTPNTVTETVTEEVIIPAGHKMKVRLQIFAGGSSSGSGSGTNPSYFIEIYYLPDLNSYIDGTGSYDGRRTMNFKIILTFLQPVTSVTNTRFGINLTIEREGQQASMALPQGTRYTDATDTNLPLTFTVNGTDTINTSVLIPAGY